MRKLVLALLFFISSNAFCQTVAFKDFNWGDSFDVVKSKDNITPSRVLNYKMLAYETQLLDQKFELAYLFKTGFLNSVSYTSIFDHDFSKAVKVFKELESILNQKYGQPWNKDENLGQSKNTKLELAIYDNDVSFGYWWEYPKGDIVLSIKSRTQSNDKVTVSIGYLPNDSEIEKIQKLSDNELKKMI
ncbi:MAG: hypothetical protein WC833_11060 [Bacteroidales bacterium]|jgi:hypothetical protein